MKSSWKSCNLLLPVVALEEQQYRQEEAKTHSVEPRGTSEMWSTQKHLSITPSANCDHSHFCALESIPQKPFCYNLPISETTLIYTLGNGEWMIYLRMRWAYESCNFRALDVLTSVPFYKQLWKSRWDAATIQQWPTRWWPLPNVHTIYSVEVVIMISENDSQL